jgi:two-component system, chemotaxis family, protein-glutamate methylesterase/glutaminase
MATTRGRDIVVVAASAGGLEALRGLLSQFPVPVSATLLVVLHVPAAGGKVLPSILGRAGLMPASAAADGEVPLPGHVYVPPSDCHMLLVEDKIRISQGPRHNGHRPAADPLFISAALSGGPHTIAVVLSGTLDDGAAGAAAVERRGGVVAIQDPGESAYDGMPRAAMAATRRATVLRLAELAAFIDEETHRPVAEQAVVPDPDLERQLSVFLEPGPRPAAQPQPVERGDMPGMRWSAPAGGYVGTGEIRMPSRSCLVAGEPAGRPCGRDRTGTVGRSAAPGRAVPAPAGAGRNRRGPGLPDLGRGLPGQRPVRPFGGQEDP